MATPASSQESAGRSPSRASSTADSQAQSASSILVTRSTTEAQVIDPGLVCCLDLSTCSSVTGAERRHARPASRTDPCPVPRKRVPEPWPRPCSGQISRAESIGDLFHLGRPAPVTGCNTRQILRIGEDRGDHDLGFGCELITDSVGVGERVSDFGEGTNGLLVAGEGHLQRGSGTDCVPDPAHVQRRVREQRRHQLDGRVGPCEIEPCGTPLARRLTENGTVDNCEAGADRSLTSDPGPTGPTTGGAQRRDPPSRPYRRPGPFRWCCRVDVPEVVELSIRLTGVAWKRSRPDAAVSESGWESMGRYRC